MYINMIQFCISEEQQHTRGSACSWSGGTEGANCCESEDKRGSSQHGGDHPSLSMQNSFLSGSIRQKMNNI